MNSSCFTIISTLVIISSLLNGGFAQDTNRHIQFPDVEGYHTLKCDLHIHTVFSDGLVWPTATILMQDSYSRTLLSMTSINKVS